MMKEKLSSFFSILICVLLAGAALCVGAVGGWRNEREAVTASGEAVEQLRTRAMDAVNLAVVAARHVGENDASVTALRGAYRTMKQDRLTSKELAQVDGTITQAAKDLAERLPAMAAVRESDRDSAYVTALTRTLCEETQWSDALRAEQEAFDKRIQASLTGRLAMLLGIEPFGSSAALEVEQP